MSKNFEEEYRHMIEEDIPDLWDRIEAQLPKDTVTVDEMNNASSDHTDTQQSDKQPEIRLDKKNNRKKMFTRRRYVAWGSLAAAVFAIFIIMPILVLMREKRESNSNAPMYGVFSSVTSNPGMDEVQSDGGMYDMEYAPAEVENSIVQGNSNNGAGGGYAPESGTPSYEPNNDRQEGMLAGETGSTVITDEEYDNSEIGESVTESQGNDSEGKETDIIYQAEVKILSAVSTEEGSIIYEAEILGGSKENWDSGWREGARLFLMYAEDDEVENSGSNHFVSVGRRYTLSLYSSGKEIESYGIGVSQPENSESGVYRTGIYIIIAVEK